MSQGAGKASDNVFNLIDGCTRRAAGVAVDELNDGEIRIRVQWISLDPYMRPRMNDMKSYMPPIPLGGAVTRAVAPLLNSGARVPICGYVSAYKATDITEVETPMQVFMALPEPPEHRFFLVTEWQAEYPEVTRQLAQWIRDGSIQYRETVAAGLENAGQAFRSMLQEDNFGKQLVKLAD